MDKQKLIAARKGKGMTQEQLANALHVSRQTVSHWENGRVRPDPEACRRLQQVLDLPAPEEGKSPASRRNILSLWIGAAVLLAAAIGLIALHIGLKSPASQPADDQWNWYLNQPETDPGQAQLVFTAESPVELTPNESWGGELCWDIRFSVAESHGVPFTVQRLTETFFNADHQPFDVFETDSEGLAAFWGDTTLRDGSFGYNTYRPQSQDAACGVRLDGVDANGNQLSFGTLIVLSPQVSPDRDLDTLRALPSHDELITLTAAENPAPIVQDEGFGGGRGWFYGYTIQNTGSLSFTPTLMKEIYFWNGQYLNTNLFSADTMTGWGAPQVYQPGDSWEMGGGANYQDLSQVAYILSGVDGQGTEHRLAIVLDLERD